MEKPLGISRWRRAVFATALLAQTIFLFWQGPVPGAFAQGTSQEVVDASSRPADNLAIVPNQNASNPMDMTTQLVDAGLALKVVFANAPSVFAQMETALKGVSSEPWQSWLPKSLLVTFLSVAVGMSMAWHFWKWGRKPLADNFNTAPQNRVEIFGFLLLRSVVLVLSILILASVSLVSVIIFYGDDNAIRGVAFTVVNEIALILLVGAVFLNLLVPDKPAFRPIPLDDVASRGLFFGLIGVTILSSLTVGPSEWMRTLKLDANALNLMFGVSTFVTTIAFCSLLVIYRSPISKALAGAGDVDGRVPAWRQFFASNWHLIACAYLAISWMFSLIKLLLDKPASIGPVLGPIIVVIGSVVVYSLAIIVIDRIFSKNNASQQSISDETDIPHQEFEALESPFRKLAEHGALVLTVVGAIAALVRIWGMGLYSSDSFLVNLLDVGIIVFLAYIAYRAVEIWVNTKRAEEGDIDGEMGAVGDGPGGGGQSRLVTLLPIFRNFLLITIVVIAGMMVLAEMGVNIGPLFAGAGVVGVAVGFGAQTLIRDIFSGAFFLVDDAFRKGEYINIGSAKGTVEKISIRSMQLRHHNGPLNTVPFGEIKQLTNFSRDWVMMKLPLRLTYDTDIERVRKLVKKLGLELLEHPELGEKFIQPLKSQGVKQMDDSAMIVRVKYMTRPGDQFDIRKVVYQRIQELFEQNDIHFAHREVTVRIADDGKKIDNAERKAVVGAVQTVIETPSTGTP